MHFYLARALSRWRPRGGPHSTRRRAAAAHLRHGGGRRRAGRGLDAPAAVARQAACAQSAPAARIGPQAARPGAAYEKALPLAAARRARCACSWASCCATWARSRRPSAPARGGGAGARRRPAYWNSLGMTLGGSGRPPRPSRRSARPAGCDDGEPPLRLQPGPGPAAPGTSRRGPALLREGARGSTRLHARAQEAAGGAAP